MEAIDTSQVSAELDEFTFEQVTEMDAIITKHRGRPGALIPVLEQIQELLGYLPPAVQLRVARGLNIPAANVYGVVTFYSFFTMVPRGEHVVRVCLGTACYVKGGQKTLDKLSRVLGIKSGECTEDRKFSLETVRCLGACGLAPVVVVDGETYGHVTEDNAEAILKQYM